MIRIRNATQDDIEPFKEVIKSSILVLCKDFYTPDQIKALLGQFPDFDLYAKWIDERVLIVAENNGVVIGFAQYTPELALIEAVHVEPSMARSHGDKRTLEIAIALGNEPELLILDEPTAGMSPDETTATMSLIQRLANEQGLTILFCEHDMEVVFNVAQSIMVMQQGRTIVQGIPEEVRQNSDVQNAYLGGT